MDIIWIKGLARLYLPVYQCESDKIKVAYAGYSSIKRNYFIRQLLNNNNPPCFIGRKWFWQIQKLTRTNNLDMVISEISPLVMSHYQKLNGYIIPEWVKMRINITRPMSEICHRKLSDFSDVTRKIRKYKLTYELLNYDENVNYFYEKFYLPYITKRHGEEAWIEDFRTVNDSSHSSLLLAVKEDGITAGIAVVRKTEDCLFLVRLGLYEGNDEYRRHGVIGAIYYFSVVEGKKLGYSFLDLGGTRAFLTDGLTKFKMGLGAEFAKDLAANNDFIWLGVNEHSMVAGEIMKMNPVIHINKHFNTIRSGI